MTTSHPFGRALGLRWIVPLVVAQLLAGCSDGELRSPADADAQLTSDARSAAADAAVATPESGPASPDAASPDAALALPDAAPPQTDGTPPGVTLSGVTASDITQTSARISWAVSEVATGQVEYGTTTAYGSFSIKETSFNYSTHSQTLSGLSPDTTYHYRVHSETQGGVGLVSGDHTFKTLSASTGPDVGITGPDASSGGPDAGPPDGPSVPTVAWQTPANGAVVSGQLGPETAGNCIATASSPTGITQVEFYVDGVLLNTEPAAPYSCLWNTAQSANGVHQLKAVARATGGSSSEATISVTVQNSATSGTHYYVSSSGSDSNSGTSASQAWRTMAKVNAQTFAPGDVVHFNGTFTDQLVGNPGSGTASAPILFLGESGSSGRAVIKGIRLTSVEHVTFKNFEASGATGSTTLVSCPKGAGVVRYLRFENLSLHHATVGVYVREPSCSHITFHNSQIYTMDHDGVLLDDPAGDYFSYIGGSITDTGNVDPGYGTHGVYASGGHEHLFDGTTFKNNQNGQGISLRRGAVAVRNCTFDGSNLMHFNEDEGSTSPFTGHSSSGLNLLIYRNLFIGSAIYQGGVNDAGVHNPGNTFVFFNNTFVNVTFNMGSPSGDMQYYNLYVSNNVFVGGKSTEKAAVSGRTHLWTHNGFFNAGTPRGTAAITADPALDASHAVTAAAYVDAGRTDVAPGVTMTATGANGMGYSGAAPDIGQQER